MLSRINSPSDVAGVYGRGRRGTRDWRRLRACVGQPERRGALIVGYAGWADGKCGRERLGDYVEVSNQGL